MAVAYFSRSRKRIVFLFVFFIVCGLISLSCAAREPKASRQKLQVHKHLKRLNKAPVKTIQMRPNYHPEGVYDENKVNTESKERGNSIKQLWHVNGMCPEDTIPIRRTKEDDVLRASSVKDMGRRKIK